MKNDKITIDEWLVEFERISHKEDPDTKLYKKAVRFVVGQEKVTVAYLEVGLGIGSNKARKLITKMEIDGVVSQLQNWPGIPGYSRKVLLQKKQ